MHRMDNNLKAEIMAHVSQSELARQAKVSRPFMHQCLVGIRQVPARLCAVIESATNGAVKAERIRPDLTWTRDRSGKLVGYTVSV